MANHCKCEQCKWKLLDEVPIYSYSVMSTQRHESGKVKLFQCEKCKRLLKIRLGQ